MKLYWVYLAKYLQLLKWNKITEKNLNCPPTIYEISNCKVDKIKSMKNTKNQWFSKAKIKGGASGKQCYIV